MKTLVIEKRKNFAFIIDNKTNLEIIQLIITTLLLLKESKNRISKYELALNITFL